MLCYILCRTAFTYAELNLHLLVPFHKNQGTRTGVAVSLNTSKFTLSQRIRKLLGTRINTDVDFGANFVWVSLSSELLCCSDIVLGSRDS